MVSRITFLCLLPVSVLGCAAPPITDVRLGKPRIYAETRGDTYDPAWADDDNLYTAGDDGRGWTDPYLGNVFFDRVSGSDPFHLSGTTIGPLNRECGAKGEEGPDGCNWKATSSICIDGKLYLFIARHKYGDKSGDPHGRQTAGNASIIQSADHGATWTRSIQECYDRPMFPGTTFPAPYFLHYGKDGRTPDIDRAREFIYAVSNNGFWCNGDSYFLGRVRRTDLPKLNGADWEYYTGGDELRDGNWSRNTQDACRLIDAPLKCGMTGATYIPSLGRYILIAWYYPGDPNRDIQKTCFVYYEAPHPWGFWSRVREETIERDGWYSPRLLSKWQRGKDGEAEGIIVASGLWPRRYKFSVLPVSFKAGGHFPPKLGSAVSP